ncbi:MAG: class I SAM-dependent methyltransferase [Candidatus Liptonbacteria bacterium]|nr:class I SAM-dependent methyltransferase [Candidatus Liptonbacteria bacterium]
MQKQSKTSWGGVADWYEKLLSGEGTYQKQVILPNLLRLMDIKPGDNVLDLACGPGFFSKEFIAKGAKVLGVDISEELIKVARESVPGGEFKVSSAEFLPFIKNSSMDKAVIVLALQNIEKANLVLAECARVLKPGGTLHLVLNHPAFRNPKVTSWGWDLSTGSTSSPQAGFPREYSGQAGQVKKDGGVQYRRVDEYLSESKTKIQMHPGDAPEVHTISFHRPLQYYFKLLGKAGFAVTRLEEWNSNRKSEPGPRAKAEDVARKEIPLFLYIEAIKLSVIPALEPESRRSGSRVKPGMTNAR